MPFRSWLRLYLTLCIYACREQALRHQNALDQVISLLGAGIAVLLRRGRRAQLGTKDIYVPPGLAQANIEQELKIQNLAILEKNTFLTGDNIYTLFWMGFAVAIPFVSLVWKRFKLFAEKFMPIVYWGIGVLFLLNYLLAQLGNLIFLSVYDYQTILFPQAVQEIKESNYQLLFVFLSLLVLWDLNFRVFPKYGLEYGLSGLNKVRTTDQPVSN